MRNTLFVCLLIGSLSISSGCGGGSSSSYPGSSGTVSMRVTDARPVLPPGTENVLVTFEGVSVQQADGKWTSLPLMQNPCTIDLLRFSDGLTTPLIRPLRVEPGFFTRVRIGLIGATIRIDGVNFPMEILPQDLQAERDFEFEVRADGDVDFTIDFDLSRSIFESGSGSFQFKPVFHLVNTREAVTIEGSLEASTFGDPPGEVEITVFLKQGAEVYTSMVVERSFPEPIPFRIFWLLPNETYYVRLRINGTPIFLQRVEGAQIPPGTVYVLNEGRPI